jgi:hypothetical protein
MYMAAFTSTTLACGNRANCLAAYDPATRSRKSSSANILSMVRRSRLASWLIRSPSIGMQCAGSLQASNVARHSDATAGAKKP